MGNEYPILAVAAIIGAIGSATLGWLDSGEQFSPRKFAKSIIHAIIGGFGIPLALQSLTPISWPLIAAAVGMGAGLDAGLNRIEGAVVAKFTK